LVEDLLENLGVLELLLDLGDDALGELALLPDFDLALVADPRVQNGLGLGSKSGLLLELESLSLKLCGFLGASSQPRIPGYSLHPTTTNLGDSKEAFCNVDDTAEVLDAVDPGPDGVGVVLPSGVQDVLDLVAVAVGPLLVHRTSVVTDSPKDAEQRDHDNGLLVDNVELIGNRGDGETGSCGEECGLGDQAVAGQSIDDGLSLGLGVVGGEV